MSILVAVPKETFDGESRVALTPTAVAALVKLKLSVVVEAGAGESAGFPDAAYTLPKIFPMLMTAAGTLQAARVFVIGVGVAGLQAISTARRLGAVVSAFDVRPAVKEQVQSVGAKFVELPLEAGAQDQGGYA